MNGDLYHYMRSTYYAYPLKKIIYIYVTILNWLVYKITSGSVAATKSLSLMPKFKGRDEVCLKRKEKKRKGTLKWKVNWKSNPTPRPCSLIAPHPHVKKSSFGLLSRPIVVCPSKTDTQLSSTQDVDLGVNYKTWIREKVKYAAKSTCKHKIASR